MAAAPAVLFSAALPGQSGTGHINERMPSDWRAHFRRHGYVLLDPIRPAVLTDPRVECWYRQNIVFYASEELLRATPELEVYRMPEEGLGIEWVQAWVLNNLLSSRQSFSSLSKQLPSALGRALRRRADRLAGLFGMRPNTRA